MAKVSKNMPQIKRWKFLFLDLNEYPVFRNDLVIKNNKNQKDFTALGSDWVPTSPRCLGWCKGSMWPFWLCYCLGRILFWSSVFQLFLLCHHANSYAVSNEAGNKNGHREKDLFKLILAQKTFLSTHLCQQGGSVDSWKEFLRKV